MKKLIILLSAMLLSAMALAQNAPATIRGTVLDSDTREGEIGAIIQLFDSVNEKPIAFTSADADGSFTLTVDGEGEYRILVTNLGRKDLSRTFTLTPGKTEDLGELLVEYDAKSLDAATVTDNKVLVKMEVDKMSYAVSEDVDSKSSTVLDMLRKVPMVIVDAQDNITVNGSSSFLVTVDGKPNQMLSQNASTAFKMMPASSVKSIEVITNPGARYDAEGVGGVLNLVTDRSSGGGSSINDGFYGTLRTQVGKRNQGIGGMVTAQKGKFSVSLNANLGRFNQKDQEVISDVVMPGMMQRTVADGNSSGPFRFGNMSLSYELDSLNLFTSSAGLFSFSMRNTSLSTVLAGADADNLMALYSADNWQKNANVNLNASFDWQHNFAGHPGRMLTLSYRLNDAPTTLGSRNEYDALLPSRKMDGKTRSDDHTLQADYTAPLGEKAGTLSTGAKFTFRENRSDQDLFLAAPGTTDYVQDPEGTTNYHFFNRIAAGYAEWSGTFGKWGAKAGGRYEYTWQTVNYKQGAGEDFTKRYGAFVPSASLQYSLGMTQNIGLTYNLRISRPGISYLNPYVDKMDPTHWTHGNPDLEIEKSHTLSLVYNYYSPAFMMNATLRHNRTGNGISEYYYTDPLDGQFQTTYGNILQMENSGVNVFANVNLGKKVRVYTNAGATYTDSRSKELDYVSCGWTWNIFAGSQQTLWWDLQLSEGVMLQSNQYNLQGYMSGIKVGFASLTKSFFDDRLSIGIQGVTHLTGGKKFTLDIVSSGHGYDYNTTVKVPIRELSFNLSWTFGKAGVSVRKTDRTIEDDSILDKASGQSSVPGGNVGSGM